MLKKALFFTILYLIEIPIISSQVLYQATLLHGKDTLTMWEKFLDYYNITSVKGDMELSTCFGFKTLQNKIITKLALKTLYRF